MRSETASARGVLGALTVSHMIQHLSMGVSVLYPSIMTSLHLNYTELGLAVGVGSILAGVLQLGMSLLSHYAPRRVILGIGNLLYSGAEFYMGLCRDFYQLFIANLVGGIGQAAQHPIGVSIISDKYRRSSVGGALGLHYGLSYVGNILGPLVLGAVSSILGWRSSLYALAIAPALVGVLLLFYLRSEWAAGRILQKISLSRGISSAIRVKGAMIVIVAQSLLIGGTGMGGLVTYTPLFLANQIHLTILDVGAAFSFMMTGGVLGTLLIGKYSDKFGHLRVAIVCSLVASVGTYLLPFHTASSVLLILHLFLMGVSGFAISSLLQAHLSSIADPSQRDTLLGLFFTIGFGLSSVWSTVMGIVTDMYGSFKPGFQLMAVLAWIATILLIWKERVIHQMGNLP